MSLSHRSPWLILLRFLLSFCLFVCFFLPSMNVSSSVGPRPLNAGAALERRQRKNKESESDAGAGIPGQGYVVVGGRQKSQEPATDGAEWRWRDPAKCPIYRMWPLAKALARQHPNEQSASGVLGSYRCRPHRRSDEVEKIPDHGDSANAIHFSRAPLAWKSANNCHRTPRLIK